jgi:hypothetical protein
MDYEILEFWNSGILGLLLCPNLNKSGQPPFYDERKRLRWQCGVKRLFCMMAAIKYRTAWVQAYGIG